MNFLLHAACAEAEGDGAAGASMLPDLWRMAQRRLRLGGRAVRVPNAAEWARHELAPGLRRGLLRHLHDDAWFHRHEVFEAGERACVAALRAHGVQSEKMVLFAHPLWELLLDGALLRTRGLDAGRAQLERAHRAAGGAVGECMMHAVGGHALLGAEGLRAAHDACEELWGALQEGPWIAAYTHAEGLTECIVRMRARVGYDGLVEGDRARLERAIAELWPLADAALERTLAQARSRALLEPSEG